MYRSCYRCATLFPANLIRDRDNNVIASLSLSESRLVGVLCTRALPRRTGTHSGGRHQVWLEKILTAGPSASFPPDGSRAEVLHHSSMFPVPVELAHLVGLFTPRYVVHRLATLIDGHVCCLRCGSFTPEEPGLNLVEAKQILQDVQNALVTSQATEHLVRLNLRHRIFRPLEQALDLFHINLRGGIMLVPHHFLHARRIRIIEQRKGRGRVAQTMHHDARFFHAG